MRITSGYRSRAENDAVLARPRFRATVLAFQRRQTRSWHPQRGWVSAPARFRRWSTSYRTIVAGDPASTLETRTFWTRRGCRRFAHRLGRDAVFLP